LGAIGATLTTVALVLFTGCDRPPSPESLRDWAPGDHHSIEDDRPSAAQPAAQPAAPRGSAGSNEATQLAELAWRQQCTTCHGPMGKGDGPTGPMVQAPDLTRAAWQSKVTDAEIVSTIRAGKNKMPKFDLPDPVLRALVVRIRSLREN
jgi:cytochrome c oxidase cbb3-type subunit 3